MKHSVLFAACAVLLACALPAISIAAEPAPPRPLILDMVHHNPGEARYETKFETPALLAEMGFNGRVLQLFDSPTLAIDWSHYDPDIFPAGSPGRAWVDEKAAFIDRELAANRGAGIATYAMGDLVLLPKALVKKHNADDTFGDPRHPQTREFVRAMIDGVFKRFPDFDGIIVRIGETYLHDAPYHAGKIRNRNHPEETIIPLLELLREEVCVKRDKKLIFRTWLSFDTNPGAYAKVDAAVEPHPRLVISIKHCENDFHRGTRFSRSIGQGRHPQLIEVQCAREYEGKGAYPNYVAHGVIDGFPEHQRVVDRQDSRWRSIGDFARKDPLYAGLWTWTRGGGWEGPYIKDELWLDLNAWVLSKWAENPAQSEEALFRRYSVEKLGLSAQDADRFRRLALASADAVLLGRAPDRNEHTIWWTRDEYISAPVWNKSVPPVAKERILARRDQSVALWREIVALADEISFADARVAEHVRVSSRYGLHLYRVYQAIWHLSVLTPAGDRAEIERWVAAYDNAWKDYRALPATSALCASLYEEKGSPHNQHFESIEKWIARFRPLPSEK
ncbi:MAG: hypothetical protein RLZZ50_908 [Verrucomicrobiota bacterium]|jgi:hypothetical protein